MAPRRLPPQPKVILPNGKRPCRGCGGELPKGRSAWCSNPCMERHYMALSAHARRRVRERDHGVCALCGVTGEWEADHIIPLAEGGTNELSNYRTLCVPCHKAETRALAGRLAQRRADYKAPRLDLK